MTDLSQMEKFASQQTELDQEFMVTLAYCTVRPAEIGSCRAGWFATDDQSISSGFVVQLLGGEWAYIVSTRIPSDRAVKTLTQRFREEPTHLYKRERVWYHWPKHAKGPNVPKAKAVAAYADVD